MSISQKRPTFSVIIAVYNNVQNLQRCIDSFSSQSYDSKELIVIDGKSTDGTVDIIVNNKEKIAYWESERDRGIYHAFNKGVSHAKGEWIIFLGSDDYFYNSDVLKNVVEQLALAQHCDAGIVYGKVAIISKEYEILQIVNQTWDKSKCNFLQFNNIYHQGVFQHRSIFHSKGFFDETFKIAGDYEFLLRELKDNTPYFLDDIIISCMKIGGVSSSPENYIEVYKEFYKARIKNKVKGFPLALLWLFLTAHVRLIVRKILGNSVSNQITDFYRKLTARALLWTRL
ncbi:glycosyltransferase family 2 protein [Calothrix sp. NIES-3974]|uniref:glycosyltransferase family 2 protein n=1 Tax=Calothrix sp. NIES-3974 TaxID=2005462 RepID=UPI000B5F3396|nr:glycosyltransferase family 2 protein [Calothrix sp. NIES-3974]BAZ05136.1 putative glycosyl transferase [Calothrix sp. NIES-3974]